MNYAPDTWVQHSSSVRLPPVPIPHERTLWDTEGLPQAPPPFGAFLRNYLQCISNSWMPTKRSLWELDHKAQSTRVLIRQNPVDTGAVTVFENVKLHALCTPCASMGFRTACQAFRVIPWDLEHHFDACYHGNGIYLVVKDVNVQVHVLYLMTGAVTDTWESSRSSWI